MNISQSANIRLKEVLGDSMLRIAVDSGGCAGYQYKFDVENNLRIDDKFFKINGIKLAIDNISYDMIEGSTLEYIETLGGGYFHLSNPKTTSSCGCGTSFFI